MFYLDLSSTYRSFRFRVGRAIALASSLSQITRPIHIYNSPGQKLRFCRQKQNCVGNFLWTCDSMQRRSPWLYQYRVKHPLQEQIFPENRTSFSPDSFIEDYALIFCSTACNNSLRQSSKVAPCSISKLMVFMS